MPRSTSFDDHKKIVLEKPKMISVESKKRIDHFGQLVIDRKVKYDAMWSPFEPEQMLLSIPIQKVKKENILMTRGLSKGTENSQETLLKQFQNKVYGNIYVFSDEEDNMEDIDKRYKNFSSGFKSFNKQKKKLNGSFES